MFVILYNLFKQKQQIMKEKIPSPKTWYFFGGDGGDRTHDLLTASQTLSRYTQKRTPLSAVYGGIDKAA